MTPGEWMQVVRLHDACWANQVMPDAQVAAWYRKLAHLPGDEVYRAMDQLTLATHWPPSLQQLHDHVLANRRPEPVPELPPWGTGTSSEERAWADLPHEQREQHIDRALSSWPSWLPAHRDSPLVQAQAAALARGVPMEPPEPLKAGRCSGCSELMELVDRPSMTAKCSGCGAEFVLQDWRE